MLKTFLPFSRPSISREEIDAVTQVLESGWITTGSNCAEFEKRFCAYCGADGAVALASATAGMHLVLKYYGIGPGDEVITPSMTWVSTVNLITLAGATPVFADIDKDTLMVDVEHIAACITERTKLIIPVHFAGSPVDMQPIRELGQQKNIPVVEDAAHAAGTEYYGKRVGGEGTAIFSFHPTKNITTGEGGMVVSGDVELLDSIRRLKFHGLGVDAFDRKQQGRSRQAEVLEPGYKYNLTDMAAAIGLGQLQRLEGFIDKRQALAERYLEKFRDIEGILPLSFPAIPHKHSWHLFVVRLDVDKVAMSREDFLVRLQEENVGTGLHFRAVHQQKYYREHCIIEKGTLANTEWNSERILSLPLFPDMTVTDVDGVVAAIRRVLS
ncbi:MAG: UDP-4-amino-4-deoxy-L-arabinose-oxoglutarate aminotransferase [Desulforhopalus sp.]|jgi:UDP-4-amino-4-deoxy-L-arabinose-oxoglutarate aminotransferase